MQTLFFFTLCSIIIQVSNEKGGTVQPEDGHKEVLKHELPLLLFLPCLNASDTVSYERCDPLIYPAILQAVEDINADGMVDINMREEMIQSKVVLSVIETKVSSIGLSR